MIPIKGRPFIENECSRPDSQGKVELDKPVSRASSRALTSRKNSRVRDAILSVQGISSTTRIDIDACSRALEELNGSCDVIFRNVSWVKNVQFLQSVASLLNPMFDSRLVYKAATFLQVLIKSQAQNIELKSQAQNIEVVEKSYSGYYFQTIFGSDLRGLERLVPFLGLISDSNGQSRQLHRYVLDLLCAALEGHESNQRRAVSLGYVERLTELAKAHAALVSTRCLAMRSLACLVGAAAIEHLLRGSTLHAAADALRCPHSQLQADAAALVQAVAHHPHADRKLEDLHIFPLLLHILLHEQLPAARCAAAAAAAALVGRHGPPGHDDGLGADAHVAPHAHHHAGGDVLVSRLSFISAAAVPLLHATAGGDVRVRAAALDLLAACVSSALLAAASVRPEPGPDPEKGAEPPQPVHPEGVLPGATAEAQPEAAAAAAAAAAVQPERPLERQRREAAAGVLRGVLLRLSAACDTLAVTLIEFLASPPGSARDAALALLDALLRAASAPWSSGEGHGAGEEDGRAAAGAVAGRRSVLWALAALSATTTAELED